MALSRWALRSGRSAGEQRRKPYLSTLAAESDPAWVAEVDVQVAPRLTLSDAARFWWRSRGRRSVILRGSASNSERYRDLVLALLMKIHLRRPRVVITDVILEPRSRAMERALPRLAAVVPKVARLVIRLISGRQVVYGVLSTDEVASFPTFWGVPPERVVYTGFSATLPRAIISEPPATEGRSFVFSGGNSLRDYDLLAEASALVPQIPIRVATSNWRPQITRATGLAVSELTHDQFIQQLINCDALVLPLALSTRSTGQQTYLNAMALGKIVIVTGAPGVRDYIEHGVTGLIVGRQPEAIAEALVWATSSEHVSARAEMSRRARMTVLEHFTEDKYRQTLLRLARGYRVEAHVATPIERR